MVRLLLHCLSFPDEQKTIYFAVFFPSLRDGDKSNHFGELKTTTPSQSFEDICPVTLANGHPGDPAISFTRSGRRLHILLYTL